MLTLWDTDEDIVQPVGAGQVRFQYPYMPESWAGQPWLTGVATAFQALQAGRPQWAGYPQLPRSHELLYWGKPTPDRTLRLPASVDTGVQGDQLYRALVPAYNTDGSFPFIFGQDLAYLQGTLVFASLDTEGGATLWYQQVGCIWFLDPVRVASLAGYPIGTVDVDTPALGNALFAKPGGAVATQLAPVLFPPSDVRLVSDVLSTPVGFTGAQLGALLNAHSVLGDPRTTVTVTSNSLTYVFSPPEAPLGGYSAVAMSVPAAACGTRSQLLTSVGITLVYNPAALAALAADSSVTPAMIFQLAATDSTWFETALTPYAGVDTFAATAPGMLVYASVEADPPGVFAQPFVMDTDGSLYPVGSATTLTLFPIATGVVLFPFTLTLPSGGFVQRPNAVVTGLPPRSGNSPIHVQNVLMSGSFTNPLLLVDTTAIIDAATTGTMNQLVAPDSATGRQWAVTGSTNTPTAPFAMLAPLATYTLPAPAPFTFGPP